MGLKIFLGVFGSAFVLYGGYCFINPAFLNEAAQLSANSATAATEIRAMYGGAEMAIGFLILMALFKVDYIRIALVTQAFWFVGLFSARLIGAFMDESFSSTYTLGGLCFELIGGLLAIYFLRQQKAA